MTDTTANLELPRILPAQAQKHVTHNEALQRLDATVQLVVQGFDAEAPPTTATEGAVWALGAAPTGDWDGQAGKLAVRTETGWLFLAPLPGWRAWGLLETDLRIWNGAGWMSLFSGRTGLGINTGFDTTNRLSVKAPATLLSHDGAGHRLKVNKAGSSETASLLFQSNWSGRAEMGIAGSDDFSVKVSADGVSWVTGLSVSAAGAVALRSGAVIGGALAYARNNIVGAVSQVGGVPTGAVVERGSNASGDYVRFADGTQICTRTASLGSIIANGAGTWASPHYTNPMTLTYAASFAAAPALSFSFPTASGLAVPDRILQPAGFDVGTASITNLRVARIGGGNADATVTCIMTAIGRWV